MMRAPRLLLGAMLLFGPISLMTQSPSSGQTGCDPHYPGQCIPPPPPNLNCADLSFRAFPVLHPNNEADPHGFDRDQDGTGCEGTAGKPAFVATATTASTTAVSSTLPASTVPPSTSPPLLATPPYSGAPSATLSSSLGQVGGLLGSSCWPQGNGYTMCTHIDFVMGGPNPSELLTVVQGETLALRFQPALQVATLTAGVLSPESGSPMLSLPTASPPGFAANLPTGTHVIAVSATFEGVPNGNATYYFKLQVLAPTATNPPTAQPAQPTAARPLALTG